LDVIILKALAWGPLHGYAITSLIRRQTDGALLVEEDSVIAAVAGYLPARKAARIEPMSVLRSF